MVGNHIAKDVRLSIYYFRRFFFYEKDVNKVEKVVLEIEI